MKREIEGRVLEISRRYSDEVIQQTGVQPSLTEQDVKLYVENVMQELTDYNPPPTRRRRREEGKYESKT
jgi:hypothetical protein